MKKNGKKVLSLLCAVCILFSVAGEVAVSALAGITSVQTRDLTASDGSTYHITVSYDTDSGIPEGAQLRVEELTEDNDPRYGDYLRQSAERLDQAPEHLAFGRAFDISLEDPITGQTYQPTKDVRVQIELSDLRLRRCGSVDVIHFGSEAELVDSSVEDGAVLFEASGFSVYVLVGVGDSGQPQCTYTFWAKDTETGLYKEYGISMGGETVYHQTVKSGKELVIPQLTSNGTMAFAGWYEGTNDGANLYLEEEPYDFDGAEITENSAVDLYAVYTNYAYVAFHDRFDSGSGTFPIVATRRGELTGTEGSRTAEIPISDVTATTQIDAAGTSMRFFGWSRTPITVPGAARDDANNPVQKADSDTALVGEDEGTLHLYPIYKSANWLTFYSAQSGMSASYVAPEAIFSGDSVPTPLPVSSREGYVFEGWYAGTMTTEGGTETVHYGARITDENGELVATADDGGVYISGGKLCLRADATLYAMWGATYHVVMWRQNTTDAPGLADGDKTYEYVETVVLPARLGDTVSVPAQYQSLGGSGDYAGYVFRLCDAPKTVQNTREITVLNVYYDLDGAYVPSGETHTLRFLDPATGAPMSEERTGVAYGQALSALIPNDHSKTRVNENSAATHVFSGWFMDDKCTVPADLSSMTMPDHDLTVYAGWTAIIYRVQIDPAYGALYYYDGEGELKGTGATYFNNTYDSEPIGEYTHVTRDYVESSAGTWYYVKHDMAYGGSDRYTYYTQNPNEATEDTTFEYSPGVYSYAGWYEVLPDGSEDSRPYDFSQHTDHATTLRLRWKKAGAYYLAYAAGEGTLEDGNKEVTLAEAYADDSEIVLTCAAEPPAGYAFAGWRVRGGDEDECIVPGDVFVLHAENAKRVSGRDVVYLDAVYLKGETATLIYDANGGTVDPAEADPGYIPGPGGERIAPASVLVDAGSGTVTVSGLTNNGHFALSDGTGFRYEKNGVAFTLKGWCSQPVFDPDDPDAPLFQPGGIYGVDAEEPLTVYAVWETAVTYHLNSDENASWGGPEAEGAWSAPYLYDGAAGTHTLPVIVGGKVSEPPYLPTYEGGEERLFLQWRTAAHAVGEAPDDSDVFDFSQPVTEALDLYAYWIGPIPVEVRAVDASAEVLTDRTGETGWTVQTLAVGETEIALLGAGIASAPENYELAFVAAHAKGEDELQSITEDEEITAIFYDLEKRQIVVRYALPGREDAVLNPETTGIFCVFYQKKALDVDYDRVESDGAFTPQDVPAEAPRTTGEPLLGEYVMDGAITHPLDWAEEGSFCAFAVGASGATSVSDLIRITDCFGPEDPVPPMRVRNTWRGFAYSVDGGESWTSCGYDVGLYVLYFPSRPVIVSLEEETVGTSTVQNTPFTYHVSLEGGVSPYTGEYTLTHGQTQSLVFFYNAENPQTVTVTQEANGDFETRINGVVQTVPIVWSYALNASESQQTVLFSNRHKAVTVEIHLALVQEEGVVLRDDLRSPEWENYSFSLALGAGEALPGRLSPEAFFVGDSASYAFGAVVRGACGEENGSVISLDGMDVAGVRYAQLEPPEGTVYELVPYGASGGNQPDLSGGDKLYYLYYPMPQIAYVKENGDGTLTPIVGAMPDPISGELEETDTITYNHAPLTMNGRTVAQNQKLELPLNGLTISQTGNNFRMPPVLDDGVYERYLSYTRVGAGGSGARETGDLEVSDGLTIRLRVEQHALQFSFDGSHWSDLPLADTPTVYAIYTERGYDLQISKTIDVPAGYDGDASFFTGNSFTVTIRSAAINRSYYEAEGTAETTVPATPSDGTHPGTIVLTVTDGTKIKLKGVGRGDYTITEAGNDNFTLTAKTGRLVGGSTSAMEVTDNASVTLSLNSEVRVDLTNTPKALCKIEDNGSEIIFYTLDSAIRYVEENISSYTAEIQMLTDYRMPLSDTLDVPSGFQITLTTAEEGFAGEGSLAVITRDDSLADLPLVSNSGSLTLKNVILDGASVPSTRPMIQTSGDLTLGASATVRSALSSGNGGAILATGGDITVNSGAIVGCTALSGGAVYHMGNGKITISGTGRLQNNTASEGDGGAIFLSGGSILITGTSRLSGNKAESGKGGAIRAGSAVISVEQNGTLTENTAAEGGAVYADTATLTVSETEGVTPPSITKNVSDGDGGAIWLNDGTATLSGGLFSENEAGGKGGAICLGKAAVTLSGTVDLESNEAASGGAVYAESGAVTISGGKAEGNIARTGSGGAICAVSGAVTVSGGSLKNNVSSAGDGGAVCALTGGVLITGGDLSDNTAKNNGGAVFSGTGTVTVSGDGMRGNRAESGKGGAIYAESGAVTLTDVALQSNGAGSDGGAVFAGSGALSLTGGSVTDNRSGENGGGLYAGSGSVTLSGVSLSQNISGACGGAVYVLSGTLTANAATSLTGNTAGQNGGGAYVGSGSAALTGPSMTGNSAVNGSAFFVQTGKAVFSGGSYTGNVSSDGGAVGMGSTSARLTFSGDVRIENNTLGTGSEAPRSNLYLDQDSDDVLNMAGLGANAAIGIYVPDSLTTQRDVPGARFASYTSDANVDRITNDRFAFNVQKDEQAKKLYWGKSIKVEVRYQASYAGGFPPTASYQVKKAAFTYFPEFGSAATSELAAELFTKYNLNLSATAAYGGAFTSGAASFDEYITQLIWDSAQAQWMVQKRDGTQEPLNDRTILIYYAEPAYISIENNTGMPLELSSMTVGGHGVINTASSAGYGMVFAKNGAIRTALLPVTAEDLHLAVGASINLLIPGGRNMAYTVGGAFVTDEAEDVRLRRTGLAESTIPADQVKNGFSFGGTTLNASGTYEIIFGDDKMICKITDEHLFTKISDAVQYAQTNGLTEATVEMLTDYLLPASDVVQIPRGYHITLTTAFDGEHRYLPTKEGETRATISRDSENKGSMISVVSGNDANTFLTLKELIFDGKSVQGSSDGGAVNTKNCGVTVEHCDFLNIYAGNGGALYVVTDMGKANSWMRVSDSRFVQCNSTKATGNRLGGGAIHAWLNDLTISDSWFEACFASDQAGAVFHRIDGNIESSTNISGCTFTNCRGKAAGGMELDSKRITVTDTVFQHCVATDRNGGGFNVYALNNATPTADCWVTVDGCTFDDCRLTTTNTSNGNGGGFRSNAVYNTVSNSTFTNCTSIKGGGFCVSNTNAKKGEVYGCTFENCSVIGQGGGIYTVAKEFVIGDYTYTDDEGEEQTRHTVIRGCSSSNEGGGIYYSKDVDNASLTVTNAQITDNRTVNSNKNGGGVYVVVRSVEITGSTITDNRATAQGGGVYVYSTGGNVPVTVTDSDVSRNTATGNGGGIWCDVNNDANRNTMIVIVRGGKLDGNVSGGDGGGIYTQAKTLSVTGSAEAPISVSDNTAKNGGGIYQNRNVSGSALTVAHATICGNTANNTATNSDRLGGGGIYSTVRTMEVTDSVISQNTSSRQGGGILLDTNEDAVRREMTLTIRGCTLEDDTAGGNGGGIYTRAKTVTVEAYTEDGADRGVTISGCLASGSGGGIYQGGDFAGSVLAVSRTTITGCRAQDSAANNPEHGGGGVYAWARTIVFTDCEITGSQAVRNGGGVLALSSGTDRMLTLDGTLLRGNTAGNQGGGVFSRTQLTLRHGTEITGNRLSNSTADNAAGVYLLDGRTLYVGAEGEAEDTLTVRENFTNSNEASNLRLWESSGENKNTSVYVWCGLSGEIRVINAKKVGTWFGNSAVEKPDGFTDDAPVFRADTNTLHGIVDRTDDTGRVIIWAGPPIAKITDGAGSLLYLRSNGTDPAIFDRLNVSNSSAWSRTSAFGFLGMAQPELYYKNGQPYQGQEYCIKMLVETYTTEAYLFSNDYPGRKITFTTAGTGDADPYPYTGKAGTRATVIRGSGVGNTRMLQVRSNFDLENIVLDGGSENGILGSGDAGMIYLNNADATLMLGEGAIVQNMTITGDGAGAYMDNGTLSIHGGVIRSCSGANGGGIYMKNARQLLFDAGGIYQCSATGSGGGVYLRGGVFEMTGGTISGCQADKGGGVFVLDNRTMRMSGGFIIQNHARTGRGGGVGFEGTGSRLYLSRRVTISNNTFGAEGKANNVELSHDSNTVIHTDNGGLFAGSYVGIYVPDGTNLFEKHGREKKPFATFEDGDNVTNLYSFVNDRNGLKGGIIEDPLPNTIYWIQIFSLQVTKQVEAGAYSPVDENEEYSFTVNIRGKATVHGQLDAKDIDSFNDTGEYGDMQFHSNGVDTTTATFTLKAGETVTAVNLSEGLVYEVIENLTPQQQNTTAVLPSAIYSSTIGENKGRTDVDPYTSVVEITNVVPVCKITDNNGSLLFRRLTVDAGTETRICYVPAVYTELTGEKGAFRALGETFYTSDKQNPTSYSIGNGIQIQMLVQNYGLSETVTLPDSVGGTVRLTTASASASRFPYQGAGTTATVRRAFAGGSMFRTEGSLALEKIILDGSKGGYTASSDGGLVYVPAGGRLSVLSGAVLQNSRTAQRGGAIFVAAGGAVTMTGGTVQRNGSEGNGAGVYLEQGSKLYLSGAPVFGGKGTDVGGNIVTGRGNFKEGTLVGKTNGGRDYSQARQDIYLEETTDTPASIELTGSMTGEAGSIWVWSDLPQHYGMTKPFAVLGGGTVSGTTYLIFRNAQTDDLTLCGNETYLTGGTGDNPLLVYWSGGMDVLFKKVDGFGNALGGAQFTIYRDADCTVTAAVTEDNQNTETIHSKAAFEVSDSGTVYNVCFNVSPGVYYMKETNRVEGYARNTAVYRLVVGESNASSLGVELNGAQYLIQRLDASGQPETDPDIRAYGILNVSDLSRKVLLKKTDNSFTPLAGAEFDVLRYDRTAVAQGCKSGNGGYFWIGTLPYGTYYIHETQTPSGVKTAAGGWWYTVSVSASGVSCTRQSATQP